MPFADYGGSHYTEGSYRRAVLYLVKMRYGVVFIDSHYEQVERALYIESYRQADFPPGSVAQLVFERWERARKVAS